MNLFSKTLQQKSDDALSTLTTTLEKLTDVNKDIAITNQKIQQEIEEKQSQMTDNESVKKRNEKIIMVFNNLLNFDENEEATA